MLLHLQKRHFALPNLIQLEGMNKAYQKRDSSLSNARRLEKSPDIDGSLQYFDSVGALGAMGRDGWYSSGYC